MKMVKLRVKVVRRDFTVMYMLVKLHVYLFALVQMVLQLLLLDRVVHCVMLLLKIVPLVIQDTLFLPRLLLDRHKFVVLTHQKFRIGMER